MFLQHRAPRGADDTINRNIFPFSKWYYRGIASHKMVARFMQLVLKKTNKHNRKKLTQKGIIAMEDPGEEPGGPTFRLLFLEAWRGRKKFLETSPPPHLISQYGWPPPPRPPLSQGLDPVLNREVSTNSVLVTLFRPGFFLACSDRPPPSSITSKPLLIG